MTLDPTWSSWARQLPPEQQMLLWETLGSMLEHATASKTIIDPTPKNDQHIPIMIPSEEEAMLHLKKGEVFVDVYDLMPLFELEAYNENVLLKGPKGIGKSLAVVNKARVDQVPLITQPCSEDTRKIDLFGSLMVINSQTVFVLGGFPLAIEMANRYGRCILVLEEMNALTPQIQKTVNELTDFRQSVTIRQAQKTWTLDPKSKVWVVGTMNPSVYGGTYDINEDLKSRFEEIDLDYPEFEKEKAIVKATTGCPPQYNDVLDQMIRFAQETRTGGMAYALAPRDVVRMMRGLIRHSNGQGLTPQALWATVQKAIFKFEGDDRTTVINSANRSFKNLPKLIKTWGGRP